MPFLKLFWAPSVIIQILVQSTISSSKTQVSKQLYQIIYPQPMHHPALGTNNRYINNTLASTLSNTVPYNPNSNLSYSPYPTNPYSQDPLSSDKTPISISDAQRMVLPVFPYPAQTLDPKNSHNSRLKEIMYDQEPGMPQRIPSRVQSPRPKSSNISVICCVLVFLALFIFVGVCIFKHHRNPFSIHSTRYYALHPQLATTEIVQTTTTVDPVPQPAVNTVPGSYPGTSMIALQNHVNRKLREGVIDSNDIIPIQSHGLCREGFFALHGVCYSCRGALGFQQITKCYNPYNTTISTVQTVPATFSPVVSTPRCPEGSALINGRCVSCPEGTTWDGVVCKKIGTHHHHYVYEFKRSRWNM